MKYLELLQQLEVHLGYHQLPLNSAATGMKDIFESTPLHHEFVRRLVQSIYTGNRCRRLSDSVEREATFEAVAPLRLEILRSERTDVDLYRTLEELCVALELIFGPGASAAPARRSVSPAQVIDIAPFRRRRLKSLA